MPRKTLIAAPLLIAIAATATLTACTSNQRNAYESPKPDADRQGTNNGNNGNNGATAGPVTTSSLPIVLDEQQLKSYNINTNNLTYAFSYLATKRADAVVFNNGKASLSFSNLEHSKSGDLKLELFEAGTLRFTGEIKGLVLKPGSNQAQLVLKPVGTIANGTGDLTIDVSTDISGNNGGGGGGSGNNGGGGGGGGNNGGGGTVEPNAPSFARDVKPIFDAHCAECHHTGKSLDFTKLPFSAGEQGAVVEKVISLAQSSMPPAPRDKLSSAQLETIRKWKTGGMKP